MALPRDLRLVAFSGFGDNAGPPSASEHYSKTVLPFALGAIMAFALAWWVVPAVPRGTR